MKSLLTILLIAGALSCGSSGKQDTAMKESNLTIESNEQEEIIVGEISMQDLEQPPHSAWFDPMYRSYKPSKETFDAIKSNIKDYEIKAFMGTWCADSQREIPKLYKVLQESGFNMKNLNMWGVTHEKSLPGDLQTEYNVHYVPTIIFYKDGKEVNRFVEFPQETFEEDIAKIVTGQEYTNPYE